MAMGVLDDEGHRGKSHRRAENTCAKFRAAALFGSRRNYVALYQIFASQL
jgi:hypothetical protein